MNTLAWLKNGIFVFTIQVMISHSKGQNISFCATRPIKCENSKYRSYNGSCNNLNNPEWGVTYSRYLRLLPANYGDGLGTQTLDRDGKPLPNAREISFTVYPDDFIEDPVYTLNAMQYGQIVAHDMSMAADTLQTAPQASQCCSLEGKLLPSSTDPKFCAQIYVPNNDPVYKKLGIECLQFVRRGTDLEFGCAKGDKPIQQLTQVNHFLDLSLVYGQNDTGNRQVRLYTEGKLSFEQRLGQDWLPRSLNATAACTLVNPNEPCYLSGDPRVNQSPQLVILHTIFLREHNRIAKALIKLNPHWGDEKLFQEARKINIGQHQHLVYYELLPILLGKQNLLKHKIIYNEPGFVDDYNSTVNPSTSQVHATAAFRFYHTNIAGYLDMVDEKRNLDAKVRLSDGFNRPRVLEEGNSTLDELTRGFCTQHQEGFDVYHDKEITNNWQRLPNSKIGLDLKAICIQRNRDHGLATYNDFRAFCGLPRAKQFKDLRDTITKKNVRKLRKLYKRPDDIDVTVGGSLEVLVPESNAGPTFLCIMNEQFYRTRVGDRFFFENSGETGFSLPQLEEIRKSSVSRLICDNTNVQNMQPNGFVKISPLNALGPCNNLPSVNLSLWKE